MVTKYVVLKESLLQSVLSDIFTFGMLTAFLWLSDDNHFWNTLCTMMFIFHIFAVAGKRTKSNYCIGAEKLKEYAEELIEEKNETKKEDK